MSEEILLTDTPAKRGRKPKTDATATASSADETTTRSKPSKRAPRSLLEVAALQGQAAASDADKPTGRRGPRPTQPISSSEPRADAPPPAPASNSSTVRSILAAAADTVRSAPSQQQHAEHVASQRPVSAPVSAPMPPPIPEPPPLPDYIPGAVPPRPEMVTARPAYQPHPGQGQGQPQGGHPGQDRGEGGFERRGRRERRRRRRGRDRDRDDRPGGEAPQPGGQPSREAPRPAPQPQQGQNGGQRFERERSERPERFERPERNAFIQRDDEEERIEPQQQLGPPEPATGLLELSPKGFGYLRLRDKLFAQLPSDVFVPADLIRKYGLREAMSLKGEACKGQRGLQMTAITEVNGMPPEDVLNLPLFEELKAINPNKRYQLETTKERLTTRVIDMMTPVGRGQRGLIVAPPRAGKTTLLQHVAEAITANYPQVHLMILLVDERPEEVTEFRRVLTNAEIFASSNDSDVKSHTRISTFAIERAKRLVEQGQHVFMLMDSITRLARAFNNAKVGGATGSGGMGVGAMEIPRRLFAAARNTRTAGSLTILATALIETGSRMDDVIFQEFKGTGNMELVLDRKIAEQYIYPAVNIFKSGTRREELLLPAFQIEKIHLLRRGLGGHKPIEAIQRVISLQERYPNNAQLLMELPSK